MKKNIIERLTFCSILDLLMERDLSFNDMYNVLHLYFFLIKMLIDHSNFVSHFLHLSRMFYYVMD